MRSLWRTVLIVIVVLQLQTVCGLFVDFRNLQIPFIQLGCNVMHMPGAHCATWPAPFVRACCTPGYSCRQDANDGGSFKCLLDAALTADYSFANATGRCSNLIPVNDQCGGTGGNCAEYNNCDSFGPWVGFCCPNGFTCQPKGSNFRIWTCQTDIEDQPAVDSRQEVLQYPPTPMPADACTCRQGFDKSRIPMACPGPWDHAASTNQVLPPLEFAPGGRLQLVETKEDAVLRGANFFGWNVGAYNFDGLWAYCDDNVTYSQPPCPQDGEIPPGDYPSPAVGAEAQKLLNTSYWGKRSMTNDFAQVVYRMKLLGLNAVRVPFRFDQLNQELPAPTPEKPNEFFTCMRDSPDYIAAVKTMDPELIKGLDRYSIDAIRPLIPRYMGMAHPPPRNLSSILQRGSPRPRGNTTCGGRWEVPFLANYTGGRGRTFNMTMCNWYLPQGEGVTAIHRFLWQIQYFVSQGFYVLLDYNSNREVDPNLTQSGLLAKNWGNLWRMMTQLPNWPLMRGRVFPDLVNEPSRWGCQWDKDCYSTNGTLSCGPGLYLFGQALHAIWSEDDKTPVFLNGLGQDNSTKWRQCGNYYPGMHWGDGFITNQQVIKAYGLSDPSPLFSSGTYKQLGFLPESLLASPPQSLQVGLAPHVYPKSITGAPSVLEDELQEMVLRWDLSWGFKMRGEDHLSDGKTMADTPVLIGEFGVKDSGNNSQANNDTTIYTPNDRMWLEAFAKYSRGLSAKAGRPLSWFFWAWNANSGDTQGLVGPRTTWREVQWTKVRMLGRLYGLQPWYCAWWPEFCSQVTW